MTDFHYTLSLPASDWHHALSTVSAVLPYGASVAKPSTLLALPVFAVIIVIHNDTLNAHQGNQAQHPDTLMQAWVQAHPYWQMSVVKDSQNHAIDFFAHAKSGKIADVSVFRYILLPKDSTNIRPDKRDAAAHMIDEQITAYLRKKLKAEPNYNYQVNDLGEVIDFDPGALVTKHERIDCHILSIAQMLQKHKLACFDMDSTLIKQEVIDELAKKVGVYDQVSQITESAMRGEIDFGTSFVRRMRLLAGADASIINEICHLLIPSAGAFATISALKALGYHTALISGGFLPFAKHVAELLGIDEFYANPLDIEGGQLTGEVSIPILDGNQKANIVKRLANERGLGLDEVVCIGDGANDLPMMAISDLGIAYHAKPIVQVRADAAVNITGLEGVLYALGYGDIHLNQPQ